MSRTDKPSDFGSLKPFDEDEFVFQNFTSVSIRYGQYHFEDITEYLIFLCLGSASRATTSPDLDVHSIFNSSASSSLKTNSLNKFEELPQNQEEVLNLGDSYISSPVISIDSDIIPDTKTWTSGKNLS